jgi:hypothetical protein
MARPHPRESAGAAFARRDPSGMTNAPTTAWFATQAGRADGAAVPARTCGPSIRSPHRGLSCEHERHDDRAPGPRANRAPGHR